MKQKLNYFSVGYGIGKWHIVDGFRLHTLCGIYWPIQLGKSDEIYRTNTCKKCLKIYEKKEDSK